jgi:hypothetical protein
MVALLCAILSYKDNNVSKQAFLREIWLDRPNKKIVYVEDRLLET